MCGPLHATSRLPQPCVWDAWEWKTRWRATLTCCSVGHCCTCHNTGHSSAKCDEVREHTHARLSDADRHACVGPCMHTSRLPQPCVWDAWERMTRWRATLTHCSVGHCCTCHNTGHSSAQGTRAHTSKPERCRSQCMCGPLHAHIEPTTAVRVGCMGAEDKMAGDTHGLQRWSLLHVPQHRPQQRQV